MKILALLTLCLLPLLFVDCANERSEKEIRIFKIGLLPNHLERVSCPEFIALLEKNIGIPVQISIAQDYEDLISKFIKKEIHMGLFGALTFLKVRRDANAEPLVMRLIDQKSHSVFISKKNQPTQITDYIGKNIVFGPQLSTSGHLMPRYYLSSIWHLEPEVFFSQVNFSNKTHSSIESILEGKADLAAINEMVYQTALKDRPTIKESLQVVWTTPSYTNYCWAVQEYLESELTTKIQDTFFSLNPKEHPDILRKLNARAYIPAIIDQFSKLEKIAREQDLL